MKTLVIIYLLFFVSILYGTKIDELTRLANSGDSKSQYMLAKSYIDGNGVEKDFSKALYWATKSTNGNNPDGLNLLAVIYRCGWGVEKNYDKAIELYQAASKLNSDKALYNLGCIYFTGEFGVKDFKKAFEYFLKAAKLGYSTAQMNVGVMYYNGIGTNKDNKLGFKWLETSARSGNIEAQYKLGEFYYRGELLSKNYTEAFKWCSLSAEKEYPPAQDLLGVMYYEGSGVKKNIKKGMELISHSANSGWVSAQINMAIMLKSDPKKWNYWMQKAAEQGHPKAQYMLAMSYLDGSGIQRNEKVAVELLRKSAMQNDIDAIYTLGEYFECKKDSQKSFEYFYKASKLRDPKAKNKLADIYMYGNTVVKKDVSKAIKLYEESAQMGHIGSKATLGSIYLRGESVKKDLSKSFFYLEQSALLGNRNSWILMGVLYSMKDFSKYDLVKAGAWLTLYLEEGKLDKKKRDKLRNRNSDYPIDINLDDLSIGKRTKIKFTIPKEQIKSMFDIVDDIKKQIEIQQTTSVK